jgi:hypothetical protein
MPNSFNNSFDENFCGHLEMHLCRTFENSHLEELHGFWCDGVSSAPYFNDNVNRDHLSIEKILMAKKIVTRAKMGIGGQDYYEMIICLGPRGLKNYEEELSLISCLPSEASMNWIILDIENKKIELQLM